MLIVTLKFEPFIGNFLSDAPLGGRTNITYMLGFLALH
jgi:hypothetical protein